MEYIILRLNLYLEIFTKELTEVEKQKQKEIITLSAKIDSDNSKAAAAKPQKSNEVFC